MEGLCREGSWDRHSVNEMTGGGDLGGRGVAQVAPQPLALSPQSGFQQPPGLLFCRQGGAMEGLEGVVVL